ncbi:hypothetical protein [Phenylobacterium sp.]|jgi:hypothetical protein|uniref:hypothetical protein n=1 Tax=Phenylobacterium sp. TaxID=1871053 RepID=UPI003783BA8F
MFNLLRLWRRRRRLAREAVEEAQFLRARHGAQALRAAEVKLRRPDLTAWGRRVLNEAIRRMRQGRV